MSVKGFPSNQKLPLSTGVSNEFATVIPTDPYRNALDVPRFLFRVGSDTVPRTAGAGTGTENYQDGVVFWVYDTSTPAKKGDICRFEDGGGQDIEFPIVKVETNRFMISCIPSESIQSGDTFYILRSVTQRTASDGSQIVVVTPTSYNVIDKASLDTTSSNITDSGFTEIIASLPSQVSEIEVINLTGIPMILAIGASGSEIPYVYFGSDGLKRQQIPFTTGDRLSLKCLQATTANSGLVIINCFG